MKFYCSNTGLSHILFMLFLKETVQMSLPGIIFGFLAT